MVAALWSNSSWDDGKNTRQQMINSIESNYDETIEVVEKTFSNVVIPEEEKLSKDNPFFAATERGLEKVDKRIKKLKGQRDDEPEVEEIDYMKDLDQA